MKNSLAPAPIPVVFYSRCRGLRVMRSRIGSGHGNKRSSSCVVLDVPAQRFEMVVGLHGKCFEASVITGTASAPRGDGYPP